MECENYGGSQWLESRHDLGLETSIVRSQMVAARPARVRLAIRSWQGLSWMSNEQGISTRAPPCSVTEGSAVLKTWGPLKRVDWILKWVGSEYLYSAILACERKRQDRPSLSSSLVRWMPRDSLLERSEAPFTVLPRSCGSGSQGAESSVGKWDRMGPTFLTCEQMGNHGLRLKILKFEIWREISISNLKTHGVQWSLCLAYVQVEMPIILTHVWI